MDHEPTRHISQFHRARERAWRSSLAAFVLASACASPAPAPRPYTHRASAAAPREQSEVARDAGLADYVTTAQLANPGLQAAYEDYVAALEVVPQKTALADPRLAYKHYVEEVETRVGPQRQALGLSQAFPWFGELQLAGDVAVEAAERMFQRFQGERLALVAEVRDAYYETYYLARAIDVVGRNRDLIRYLEEVARTRYSTGGAQHSDVIRAQVELGKLEDRLRSLEDRKRPVQARLNAALGRSSNAEIVWPERITLATLEVAEDQVLAWMIAHNPELHALRHEVAGARHAIELARTDGYPDFALGLDYIDTGAARMSGVPGSGDDALLLGVSLSLPIQRGKYAAAVREAESRLTSAAKRSDDLANRLESRAATVLYRLRDAERKIQLYRDTLIPKSNQSLAATETAYRGGASTFSDLVDVERVLLEFELSYERALADHGQQRAELERLVGRELPFHSVREDETETPR